MTMTDQTKPLHRLHVADHAGGVVVPLELRPFTDVLAEQSKGGLLDELTEKMAQLTRAVTLTGRKGTLALVLELSPTGKGNVDQLVLSDKVTLKAPEARGASIFFPDPDGNLTRTDPNQDPFPGMPSD